MSARVINPVMLAEFTKIRSPAVRSHFPSTGSLAKIKKDLFGPVDKEDSKRFVNAELSKHQMAASKRWGFDFVCGFPLVESTQYIWERVPPTTSVPEVYTLSRAAHAREVVPSKASVSMLVPSFEDLLDQRSERSNRTASTVQSTSNESVEDVTASTSTQIDGRLSSRTTTGVMSMKTLSPSKSSTREKRQPKITDYLKERKRLTPTKKLSPSKKTRNTIALMLRQ